MRLIPILSGLLLLSATAAAQHSSDMAAPDPGQQPPADQSAPPPSAPAQAPPAPAHMNFAQRFRAANTTNDGRLTLEQAQAGGMNGIVRHFQQIDADHKGYVTFQDVGAWRRAQYQLHHGQSAPPPPAQPEPAPPPPASPQ